MGQPVAQTLRAATGVRRAVILCLGCVTAFLLFSIGIDTIPVTDRDEARFAQASKQMAVSGDYIDIRFQDRPRHKKPVGIYWAQTLAAHVTGTVGGSDIWVYRLPSVLAASVACIALYWAGLPLVGSLAAFAAALMLASTFLVHVEARIAKTDATLLFATIVAMGALARVWLNGAQGWRVPAVFWTATAAGILVKGPLILLPILGAVLLVSLVARDYRWLAGLRPLFGLAWLLVLVLPWYGLIIAATDGAFLAASLGQDLFAKVGSAQESHGAPPGSYIAAFWLTAWPWCVLAPAAAVLAYTRRKDPKVLFLIGWILPMWLVLELVPTKLLHYPLPVYPAIFLLSAAALAHPLPRASVHGGAALACLAALVLAGVAIAGPAQYGEGLASAAAVAAVIACASVVYGTLSLYRANLPHALTGLAIGGVLMPLGVLTLALPNMTEFWVSERLARATHCHSGPLYLVGYSEPSAVFRVGTDIILTTKDVALTGLAADAEATAWIAVDAAETDQTIRGFNYSNGTPVVLQRYEAPGTPSNTPLCRSLPE
ncbi:MAG: glycosyltransferase family 39 protein [Pseudomonadota bacterium]